MRCALVLFSLTMAMVIGIFINHLTMLLELELQASSNTPCSCEVRGTDCDCGCLKGEACKCASEKKDDTSKKKCCK
jgi:hypothetical protein